MANPTPSSAPRPPSTYTHRGCGVQAPTDLSPLQSGGDLITCGCRPQGGQATFLPLTQQEPGFTFIHMTGQTKKLSHGGRGFEHLP